MPEISTSVSSHLFYRKMGSGPVLVLLHGFPESGTLWRNVWDSLSASFTLIVPDFPGSGNSVLERETTMEEIAACVKAILDAENTDKAVIAGHSMGGYAAFAFAAAYPDRVAGLSLVHSTPDADSEEKKNTRLKVIELILKGGKSAFINQMVPDLFSAGYKRSNPLPVKNQVDEAMLMRDASLINFYRAMIGRKDTTAVLESARFPVQWMLGMEDTVISYKKILEKCHKSGINFVSFYNNCGHMSMFEKPEQLVTDLRYFANYSYDHHCGAL